MRRFLTITILLMASVCAGDEHHVPADFASVRDAVIQAAPGDTVTVAAGTYQESQIPLKDGLLLRGATGDPQDVILDGDGAGPIVLEMDITSNASITLMSFINGQATAGGAIRIQGASELTISDCIFTNNQALQGGALYLSVATAGNSIRSCKFIDNRSESHGGAIHNATGIIIEGCSFEGNQSGGNGGAIQDFSSGLIRDCSFFGNSASGSGGALYAATRSEIEQCTFIENSADLGGACASAVLITRSSFSFNSARIGGAIWRPIRLSDSEFLSNQASELGGAVYTGGHPVSSCIFRSNTSLRGGALTNSILIEDCEFSDNSATIEGGAIFSSVFNRSHMVRDSMFAGNQAPIGSDGSLPTSATLTLSCCRTPRITWNAPNIIIDDTNCLVANETVSFGRLKSYFR